MADSNDGLRAEDFGVQSGESGEGGGDSTAVTSSGKNPYDDENMRGFDSARMKMVLDVPLKVTVELGRTKLLVNDLLQLGQGSVIELDKMAGEPMEIYINDKLVAMGEVVVVNEKFGVRLSDVMSGVGFEESLPKDVTT